MGENTPGAFGGQGRRVRSLVRTTFSRYLSALRLVRSASGGWLTFVLVLSLVSGVTLALQLLVGLEVLEILTEDEDPTFGDLTPWLLALGAVLLGAALSNSAQQRAQDVMSEHVSRHALDQLLAVSIAVPYASFEESDFHDELRKAESNAIPKVWSTVWGFVGFGNHLVGMAALVAVVVSVMPALLLFAIVAYLPLWWATNWNAREIHRASVDLAPVDRDLDYHRRMLSGRLEAKEIRSFALGDELRRRHRALFDQRIESVTRVVLRGLTRTLIGLSVSTALLIAAVSVLLWRAVEGELSVASAAVGIVGLQQLGGRVRALDGAASSLRQGMLFFEDFQRFVGRVPESHASVPAVPLDQDLRRLEVTDLGFTYPGTIRPVLHGVTFTIGGSQLVALVGPNGSGKSTLAKILCGLYAPSTGEIRWNGRSLDEVDLADLRRQVSPVFQDFVRYELSVRDNISFGDLESDDDDAVRAAALAAGADGFVSMLADGYDTRLSREFAGGAELSIGQWQRLAIARCFLRDAPFMVLDEPSSALDAEAEMDLFDRVRSRAEGRTTLLISHRLASVRSADLILVMDGGRLVQTGTHEDLVARPGVYRRLYEIQARRYVDVGDPAETCTDTTKSDS